MFSKLKAAALVAAATIPLVGAQAPSVLHPTAALACSDSITQGTPYLVSSGGGKQIAQPVSGYCLPIPDTITTYFINESNFATYGFPVHTGAFALSYNQAKDYATPGIQWCMSSQDSVASSLEDCIRTQ